MSAFFNSIFKPFADFLGSPVKRCLLLISILLIVALVDFFSLGLARRTLVFYTIKDGVIAVEDRMVKHSQSREDDIIRYVQEALSGPVSPELLPIVTRGTKLKTLLYREGVVYIDLTSEAAMPPIEGGRTLDNFRTFHDGIIRNFSYVKDVRFFIEGTAIFADNFL